MVLDGFGLISSNEPEVSESGYVQVRVDENLAEKGTITGDTNTGVLINPFDKDTTTSVGTSITQNGVKTITFDLLAKYSNCSVICYFSSYVSSVPTSCVSTLDISDDNSNWTNLSSASTPGLNGETFTNYSGQHSFRYIRIQNTVTGFQGIGADGGRVYILQVGRQ